MRIPNPSLTSLLYFYSILGFYPYTFLVTSMPLRKMKLKYSLLLLLPTFFLSYTSLLSQTAQQSSAGSDDYLKWDLKKAETIGQSTVKKGRSGSMFDLRIMDQDKAINYQLRATLFTPEVIRASARAFQLRNRLSADDARLMVKEAEDAGDLVVMIEIDPAEGSGVVPLDWRVFLEPAGFVPGSNGAVPGTKAPKLKNIKALRGTKNRDYEYDVFWVTFPLVDDNGRPVFDDSVNSIELVVGIYKKEGKLTWQITPSLRERIKSLSKPIKIGPSQSQ